MSAKPGKPRHLLVEARVVLHRARAERIEAAVDRVVLAAEAHVVAHDFGFGQARQADRRRAAQAAEAIVLQFGFGQIDAAFAGAAEFEDQRLFVVEAAMAGDRLSRRARRRAMVGVLACSS